MGVSNKQELKKLIPTLRLLLKNKDDFEEIYSFCYKYALEPGQKILSKDVAVNEEEEEEKMMLIKNQVALWRLLLNERHSSFAKEW